MNPYDPLLFRQVLGYYPTGVCLISTADPEGNPIGMIVGSFTSVSLDPPLVAFFPAKSSTTWPKIAAAGHFCVNILSANDELLCKNFATKTRGGFADIAYRLTGRGAPIIEGIVAWINCDLHAVHEAGDHFIAVGQVRGMHVEGSRAPLVFLKGSYHYALPLRSDPDS